MIDTNDLGKLALSLEAIASAERGADAIADLRGTLDELLNHPEYAFWSEDTTELGEHAGKRCLVPRSLRGRRALERLGLLDDDCLLLKVHRHAGKVLFTDGLWVNQDIRVFPFSDESQLLLEHATTEGYAQWASAVIDPATGCGHHLVALGGACRRYGFDVNPRAILYATMNTILNDVAHVLLSRNNIASGIPQHLDELDGTVLFLVNMPFALTPIERALPLSADGGLTGARWTFAALQAIYGFGQRNSGARGVRACILCYSVGNRAENRWEVVQRAEQLFPGRVRWKVLKNERMWRVNGKKEQPNPMDLVDGLPRKADCRFYVRDEQREKVRAGYHELARTLATPVVGGGGRWDVLGYGLLDVDVR
jgi:hypothetical protein